MADEETVQGTGDAEEKPKPPPDRPDIPNPPTASVEEVAAAWLAVTRPDFDFAQAAAGEPSHQATWDRAVEWATAFLAMQSAATTTPPAKSSTSSAAPSKPAPASTTSATSSATGSATRS